MRPFGVAGQFMPVMPFGGFFAPYTIGNPIPFIDYGYYGPDMFQSYNASPSNETFSGPGNGADSEEQSTGQPSSPSAGRTRPTDASASSKVGEGIIVSKISDEAAVQPDNAIPRTSDSIDARIEPDGRVRIRWSGAANLVSHVTMALLDKDRKVLKTQTLTRLPVEARFALTNKTAYYQVVVHYVNHTLTSVISPL